MEAQRPAGIACRVSLEQVEDAVSLQRSELMTERPDESQNNSRDTETPTDEMMSEKTWQNTHEIKSEYLLSNSFCLGFSILRCFNWKTIFF